MNDHRIIIEKPQTNGVATTALILGLFGALMGIIPLIGWFTLPISLLAAILGFIGLFKKVNRGYAMTGVILGVGIVIYKLSFWFWAI